MATSRKPARRRSSTPRASTTVAPRGSVSVSITLLRIGSVFTRTKHKHGSGRGRGGGLMRWLGKGATGLGTALAKGAAAGQRATGPRPGGAASFDRFRSSRPDLFDGETGTLDGSDPAAVQAETSDDADLYDPRKEDGR